MKNIITKYGFNKFPLVLCLCVSPLIFNETADAAAHSRDDARQAVISLRHTITNQRIPDELGSIETTFSVAEQYFKQNNLELSEQYYLLTIQKARILKSSLLATQKTVVASISPAPSSGVRPNILQSGTAATNKDPNSIPASTTCALSSNPPGSTKPTEAATKILLQSPEDSEEEVYSDEISSKDIVGASAIYVTEKNDTLRIVAAKLGVSKQQLADLNGLNAKTVLKTGQKLKYNNRKIVPHQVNNGIIINIPDRTLYYFKGGKLVRHMPVALGVPLKNKKFDWRTPTGKFKITSKKKDPTWYVPPSIQEEMEDAGKEVITSIPPGPNNPLGKYAFKTSLPGILIHSTTKPWSIYSYASHGCIRVYPQHMEEFFKEISVNTPGEIIYRPVKIVAIADGRIFLEVHRDIYSKGSELGKTARQLIEKHKLADRIDWDKVKDMIKQRSGIAEDISL